MYPYTAYSLEQLSALILHDDPDLTPEELLEEAVRVRRLLNTLDCQAYRNNKRFLQRHVLIGLSLERPYWE